MKTHIAKLAYGTALSLMAVPALASSVLDGANAAKPSSNVPSSLTGSGGVFQTVSDTLIFIVGAVAVIMLVVGGLRYVVSQGDATQVKAAKDTILYSILGIVVALLAYAVVAFVSGALIKHS